MIYLSYTKLKLVYTYVVSDNCLVNNIVLTNNLYDGQRYEIIINIVFIINVFVNTTIIVDCMIRHKAY